MKNLPSAFLQLSIATLFIAFTTSAFAEVPKMTSFRFDVQYNEGKISDNIVADIYGDSLIVAIIPRIQTAFDLRATFTTAVTVPVTVNEVEQQSTVTINNFSSPVTYIITSGADQRKYTVKLVYTGLPLVYVYTENEAPIENKDDYLAGSLKIYSNVEGGETLNVPMTIKGRGNSTWMMPKKPYRIKLGSAASVLGMPSDKDWVLLANYADKTLMRTSLAFGLGYEMNFAWTPRMLHVDLVVNGVYQGNYLIGEHVKVDKDRVNIKELDEDDTEQPKINGGYFLELDNYRDGVHFLLNSGLPIVFKSPDEPNDQQYGFIKDYMQRTEDAINASNFTDPEEGYAKYLDRETFIEYYWVQEIFKNLDAQDGSSIYYYKDRDKKLNMGPLWDFDVSAGNVGVNNAEDPTGFYIRESKWFKRLFEDPDFRNAANARWATLKAGLLANLPNVIDSYATQLDVSQRENFHKWDILNKIVYPSPLKFGSYKGEVDYLKTWLQTRIAWIDAHVEQPVLTPITLISPADEIRYVVSPSDQTKETFKWSSSTDGSSYKVVFDKLDGDLSNGIATFNSNFFTQDTTASITHSQLYDLFAHVDNKDSVTLKWTASASLGQSKINAQEPRTIKIVSAVLGIPKLDSPAADATIESTTPAMRWFKAHLATKYDLQVSADNNFSDLAVSKTGLADTAYVVTETLSDQTTYFWRVRAANSDGFGNWSVVRSFTTPLISGVGESAVRVAMFPNPTSKELFIDLPSVTQLEYVELVDALGRTAISVALSPGATTNVDVSALQRGMYMVILRGKSSRPVAQKIVLR